MSDDVVRTGGCLCGNIRFAASGPPDAPHTCACGMCRRHSGAPVVAWVEYPRSAVQWVGPGGAPATWRSSDISARAFCSVCGSALGAIDDAPVVALATGAFDEPDAEPLVPKAHSFAASCPSWLKIKPT